MSWHLGGSIFEFGSFLDGERNGEWSVWDADGTPVGKSTYTKGTVTNGTFVEWHLEGIQLKTIGMLRDGKKRGEWKEYDRDGALLRLENHEGE